MATRGAIARLTSVLPLCWEGRYVHDFSAPTGLGAELWKLYHGPFQRDLDQMLHVLLDEHPAGWNSLLDADFSSSDPTAHGHCYCHRKPQKEPRQVAWLLTDRNVCGSGMEWIYVFTSAWAVTAPDGSEGPHRHNTLLILRLSDEGAVAGQHPNARQRTDARHTGGGGDPHAPWRIAGVVDLHGMEPDWLGIEQFNPTTTLQSVPESVPHSHKGSERNAHLFGEAQVSLDQGRPHLYRVQFPHEAHHYVGKSRDENGIMQMYCTCSLDEEAPSPDCAHSRAVGRHHEQQRKQAQKRQQRGLRYTGERVQVGTCGLEEAALEESLMGEALVMVWEGDHPMLLDPAASQQLRNHSPSGFEWGYSGSGPAQLALAILLDYSCDEEVALEHYQAFKSEHLAPLCRQSGWEVDAAQIEAFLLVRRAGRQEQEKQS